MTRRVMIIGNGEIGAGLADVIDAAEIVIRFNDCRSFGPGGSKTDIVAVCNTGQPAKAMLDGAAWSRNRAVALASTVWCVRDPAKFAAMRAPFAIRYPELNDFCDDYTDGFADYARQNGKNMHIVPAATHEALDRDLAEFTPEPYVCPSSGAVAIAEFLAHCAKPGDQLFVAGFGHYGWDGHPWDSERQWVDGLVAMGKLQRLEFFDIYGTSQKVGNS